MEPVEQFKKDAVEIHGWTEDLSYDWRFHKDGYVLIVYSLPKWKWGIVWEPPFEKELYLFSNGMICLGPNPTEPEYLSQDYYMRLLKISFQNVSLPGYNFFAHSDLFLPLELLRQTDYQPFLPDKRKTQVSF